MLKLTQPHLFMNHMFPPINAHSRPPSEDLRGVSGGGGGGSGAADIHSASKQQQLRRQHQTIDQQRRSPLRIIYRSNDHPWNEHPNGTNATSQALRAGSPMKSKLATSARHLANGILHEGTGNTMLQLPTSFSPSVHPQYAREDVSNGDLNLSSATRSRHTPRLQRTSSHFDKPPGTNGYGLPLRSESYRSSRLDYGTRPRNTSSKQRTHVNSKTSFHDVNGGEFYLSSVAQDENAHFLQPPSQPSMNMMSSTQRLNGSTLDITTSRKPLSPAKSNTFNVSASGTAHHTYHSSNQELHRSETNIDRNNMTRFAARGTTSKEQLIATSKFRQTSSMPAARITPTTTSNTPAVHPAGERHPSAQSYQSRDPNVSYAYSDVKKYIEENELMSPEKEQIIRNWILDVEKYRNQLQKIE